MKVKVCNPRSARVSAALEIAAVFESVDSFLMPTVVGWSNGPGKMSARCIPMNKFEFVDRLAAAKSKVTGVVNLARYQYWMNLFSYMRAIADTSCAAANFATAMKAVGHDKLKASSIGLPARKALIANATEMVTYLQQTLTNVGELGAHCSEFTRL